MNYEDDELDYFDDIAINSNYQEVKEERKEDNSLIRNNDISSVIHSGNKKLFSNDILTEIEYNPIRKELSKAESVEIEASKDIQSSKFTKKMNYNIDQAEATNEDIDTKRDELAELIEKEKKLFEKALKEVNILEENLKRKASTKEEEVFDIKSDNNSMSKIINQKNEEKIKSPSYKIQANKKFTFYVKNDNQSNSSIISNTYDDKEKSYVNDQFDKKDSITNNVANMNNESNDNSITVPKLYESASFKRDNSILKNKLNLQSLNSNKISFNDKLKLESPHREINSNLNSSPNKLAKNKVLQFNNNYNYNNNSDSDNYQQTISSGNEDSKLGKKSKIKPNT